jgi:hypothetical protein
VSPSKKPFFTSDANDAVVFGEVLTSRSNANVPSLVFRASP